MSKTFNGEANVFKSFEELARFINPPMRDKVTPPAMMISATIFIDAHTIIKDQMRLVKATGSGKIKRTKVNHVTMKKYARGNSDGSTTITGLNAIRNTACQLLTM